MQKLKATIASSVKSLGKSTMADRKRLTIEERKLEEQKQTVALIKGAIEETDALIKKKTGGYGFDDLFNIEKVKTGEKDGKPTYADKLSWKYSETYLPNEEESDTSDETKNTVESQTEMTEEDDI